MSIKFESVVVGSHDVRMERGEDELDEFIRGTEVGFQMKFVSWWVEMTW